MPSPFGRLAFALFAAALSTRPAAAGPAAVQTASSPAAPSSPTESQPAGPPSSSQQGYLSPGDTPDVAPLIGPPPAPDSGGEAGDLATFKATRALQGGARWDLATRDAVYGPDAMLRDFSCAIGVQLTAANSPALERMLGRVGADDGAAASRSKKVFKRPRPFVDHEGPICVAKDASLARSYSYPSGHSTYSWTVGLVLAEAAPERATQILARARAYGESRVVCGVHYESDVQAGRVAASVIFIALQANPEFQHDLTSAHAEMAAARAAGGPAPDARECRIEDDAAAHPVW